MVILAKQSLLLKESFKASLDKGNVVIEGSSETALRQAHGFWDVAAKSRGYADYLGETIARFPLRAVWWRGDEVPEGLADTLLSYGMNVLLLDQPALGSVPFNRSRLDLIPDIEKTTGDLLLDEIRSVERGAPMIFMLPKGLNPEWFWSLCEEIDTLTVIAFDAADRPFWESLRAEAYPTTTRLMPVITDLKDISLLSRCNRHPFAGFIAALDGWPQDPEELWVAGYSQWFGLDPALLAETWHEKKS